MYVNPNCNGNAELVKTVGKIAITCFALGYLTAYDKHHDASTPSTYNTIKTNAKFMFRKNRQN